MSLESELQTMLVAISPKVYPDFAPAGTVAPYLTWQQVGGKAENFLGNEVPDKRNARIQINAWATTRAAANALMLQVEAAMIAASHRPIGALLATADEDLNLRGAIQDFTVWASR